MMSGALFLLCGALLVLTASMIVASFPLRSRAQNGLAFGVVCYGQIVLLTQILSEMRSIWWPGYLVGQFVMLGAAFLVWVLRGYPTLIPRWRVVRSARARPLLALLIAISGGLAIYSLALALAFPGITGDASIYHLPRAYFWLQQGTARHFFAHNHRLNEFPPNASFVYLWVMSISLRTYTLLVVPPWLAGIVTGAGTYALARQAGATLAGAVVAAVLLLSLPQSVLQMGSKQNDMHTAATAVSFLVFAIASLRGSRTATAYAGVAFGLMLGTKYTAFFLLPGAAVLLVVVAVVYAAGARAASTRPSTTRARKLVFVGAVRKLVPLAVSCIVGFALFGAYNYVLNTLSFGNPITSLDVDSSSDVFDAGRREHFYNAPANLVRYHFQSMDWSPYPVQKHYTHALLRAHDAVYRWLSDALSLDLAGERIFYYLDESPAKRESISVGYGPIGYLVLLSALPLGVALLMRAWWFARTGGPNNAVQRALWSGLFLLVGYSWLLLFSMITPYSPWRHRYFLIFLPLLFAGAVPWLVVRRGMPIVIVCLAVAFSFQFRTSTQMLNRPFRLSLALEGRLPLGVVPGETEVAAHILSVTPENGTVGFFQGRYLLFHFMPLLPNRTVALVDGPAMQQVLDDRNVHVLVGVGSLCDVPQLQEQVYRIPGSGYCLLLPKGHPAL